MSTRACGAAFLVFAALASAHPSAQTATRRLFVFAADRSGGAVDGLAAGDLDVKENGATCPIIRASHPWETMRVVLLVDNSDAAIALMPRLRRGLHQIVDRLPAGAEAALVTVSGGYSLRCPATVDRTRLGKSIDGLFGEPDAGTQVARAMMESESRLMSGGDRWAVYVIVATDAAENTTMIKQPAFDAFADRLQDSAATVHAVLVSIGGNSGSAKVLDAMAKNLAGNSGGLFVEAGDNGALPDAIATVGDRIAGDAARLATAYEIEYTGGSRDAALEVGTSRPGVMLTPSFRRVP